MSYDVVAFALKTPGHLWFSSNRVLAERFDRIRGHVETYPTGHLVFYRPDGRRFLSTDPSGHPLHECEWETDASGAVTLSRARVRLDWGRWVGIKPCGLVNEIKFNLTAKPGWEHVQPEDLREMAARALRVPIEEVRWFYRDEDLKIDAAGLATIRQRKDALYVLENGGFERARFMSCMGAMHWSGIDFLPVVELFKSLLPGTGSAVFELIRGLYDDQNRGESASHPLLYRGIPTYPSEAAFRLFSNFFTPRVSQGGDPLACFMDPSKSHRIAWLPAQHPPARYVDDEQGLCLTVQNGLVQKVTQAGDATGLSYFNPSGRRIIPLDRSLYVEDNRLALRDRDTTSIYQLTIHTQVKSSVACEQAVSPVDWRTVFVRGLPLIGSNEAFETALLYPEDEQEISELAAQPFVADYVQDLGEQDREIGRLLSNAERILIVNGDAVISTCVLFDRPRDYTVSCHHVAYAQRQVQQLWTQCAEVQRWEWLRRIRIIPATIGDGNLEGQKPYDLVYQWVPYNAFDRSTAMKSIVMNVRHMLRSGGEAFLVGPADCGNILVQGQLAIRWSEAVVSLPPFRVHKTVLPKARLKEGLTLFQVMKP